MKIRQIISTIIGCAFVLGLLWTLTHRETIIKRVTDYASTQIEMHTGWQVQFEHVQLSLPFELHFDHIKLLDHDRTLLAINDCTVKMNLWDAIRGHLTFSRIYMGDFFLQEVPPPTTLSPSAESTHLLHHIKIKNLEIQRLQLSETILTSLNLEKFTPQITSLLPISVKASGMLDPSAQTGHIDLAISQTDTPQNFTQLALVISKNQEKWHAQLHVTEPGHGMLAHFGRLPANYTYQGFAQLSGPLQNWTHPLSTAENMLEGDFQLSYTANHTENPPTPLTAFLQDYGCIKGLCSLNTSHGLQMSDITGIIGPILLQGKMALSLDGMLDGSTLSITTRDASTTLTPHPLTWQGLKIACHCLGPLSSPQISVVLNSDLLQTDEHRFEDVALQLELSRSQQVLHGLLNINSIYQQNEVGISTTFAWEDGVEINLSNLKARIGDAQMNGDVRVTMPEMDISGKISGRLDMQALSNFIKVNTQGMINFDALARKEDSSHVIDVILESQQIQIADLNAGDLHLNATIRAPLDQPNVSLNLSCRNASFENLKFVDLHAETNIDPQTAHWPFTLSSGNLLHDSLHLHSKGFWHLAQDGLRLTVDEATGTLSTYPLSLQEPVSLLITPNTHTLSPLSATIGPAKIFATVTDHNDNMQGSLRFNDLPLALLRAFYPELLANGTVNAEISLTETNGNVNGLAQIAVDDIILIGDDLHLFPTMRATFEAHLQNETLQCNGHMVGMGPHPIDLTATLPVALSLHPPSLFVDRHANMHAQLALDGKIESLLELFLPITTTPLTGNTAIALNITGTLANPLIKGHLDVTDGAFELIDIGTEVKNVNGHAEVDGTHVILTSLHATGENSGSITGSGTAELKFDEAVPFDLTFQLDDINIAPFDYAEANASGKLSFKGNARSGKIAGKLTTESMQIIVPENLPVNTQAVQVTYINQPTDRPPPTSYIPNHSLWPLAYNLQIDIPGNGLISGHDWSSQWKGNIVLTGIDSEMQLNGSCQLIKGEYRFNGEPFIIREGTITFAGDPKKKTSLYVVASKDLDTILVDVILKGPIKNPAISFRSNPPMSQREILSWILFNRGSSEITTFQGTQLNDSITNLNTGGSSKPDVLTRIRKRMGIDRLDISRKDHGDSNEVSVQVGKYISRGILVSVNKGITDETNRLGIEANVIKDVKVQAEVSDDNEAQLHLKWKKDY